MPDIKTIIDANQQYFKDVLNKGSVVVEFSYYFAGYNIPRVHFVVLRVDHDSKLFIQSSKCVSKRVPQE